MSSAASLSAERVLILDFGSQVTQIIARRVRESGVYCEIHPFGMSDERIREYDPKAIILSGSPASVTEANGPSTSRVAIRTIRVFTSQKTRKRASRATMSSSP